MAPVLFSLILMLKIRRYFITGLIVLLPVVITLYVLVAVFRFCDGILGRFINAYLKSHLGYSIPGLGLLLGIVIILLAGFLVTHLYSRSKFFLLKSVLLKTPLVNKIYPAARYIVNFLFSRDKPAFKKVVMVEYPRKGIWSIGFVTNEGIKEAQEKLQQELFNVFIPTTPTPLSGFFMLVPKRDIIFLDISMEESMKLIISGGMLNPQDIKHGVP